jgi:hypothetical protein
MTITSKVRRCAVAAALAGGLCATAPAQAEMSEEDLAKLAQNPVANMISVPFQNNTNFNFGPDRGTQDVLNIQPVVPISLTEDWIVITRTILPVISMPSLGPRVGAVGGLGDALFTAFLSPAAPGAWIWGAGPAVQVPTHTNATLGNDNLGLGPSFVVLHTEEGNPWLAGVLANTIWSLGTSPTARAYNTGLVQPFVNYNFKGGLYLVSAPIATVDWLAPGGQQLLLPVGGGIGKIFHIGKQPVNAQLSAYYNIVRPDYAPDWQLRAQVQLLFPK